MENVRVSLRLLGVATPTHGSTPHTHSDAQLKVLLGVVEAELRRLEGQVDRHGSGSGVESVSGGSGDSSESE